MRIAGAAPFCCFHGMNPDDRAYYLLRTLEEEKAARGSTAADKRQAHEELAIAYELRCLFEPKAPAAPVTEGESV
jgi:hypothetical protein